MEIKCVRCEKKFDIDNEKIEKIKAMQLEEMGPQDYLDYFPFIAGRCGKKGFEDKKHAFVFTEEYKNKLRDILTKYGESEKEIQGLEKEKKDLEVTNGKLENDIEILKAKITENEELIKVNIGKIEENDRNLINFGELKNDLGKRFKDVTATGTDEIKLWSEIVMAG